MLLHQWNSYSANTLMNRSSSKSEEMKTDPTYFPTTSSSFYFLSVSIAPQKNMALRAAPSNWFVVLRSWWQGSQSKAGFHQRLFSEITNFRIAGRTDSTCSVWADPSRGFIKTVAFQLSQSTTKHGTNLYTSRMLRLSSASTHTFFYPTHIVYLHKQGLESFYSK